MHDPTRDPTDRKKENVMTQSKSQTQTEISEQSSIHQQLLHFRTRQEIAKKGTDFLFVCIPLHIPDQINFVLILDMGMKQFLPYE